MNLIGASALLAILAVAAMAGPVGWILAAIGLAVLWNSCKPK
jgi:hypothetical protein